MGVDVIEIRMNVEDHFGIDVPDWDLAKTEKTVGEFYDVILDLLFKANSEKFPDEIWNEYVEIIGEILEVPPNEIKKKHRFVRDLGAS